jgi:hypothetical protein
MLPFFLYCGTAAVTGLHIYTLLALAVYGVPVDPLELLALLGSFVLLAAAYVSLFKPQLAAKIALLAALLIWSFYGPAVAKIVRAKFEKQSVFSGIVYSQIRGQRGAVIFESTTVSVHAMESRAETARCESG